MNLNKSISDYLLSLKPYLIDIAGLVATFLSPVSVLILNIYLLIFFDLITGILVAIKLKQKIVSSKLAKTIYKTVAYSVAIISALIIQKNFFFNVEIVKIISAYISLTELKSIFENFYVLTGVNLIKILSEKLPIKSKKTNKID